MLYDDEVIILSKPPRKRVAPENVTKKPKVSSEKPAINESSIMTKTKKPRTQPKYFIFPETNNSEENKTADQSETPIESQKHDSAEHAAPIYQSCPISEIIITPTFGLVMEVAAVLHCSR